MNNDFFGFHEFLDWMRPFWVSFGRGLFHGVWLCLLCVILYLFFDGLKGGPF